jgi:hypothetical protein
MSTELRLILAATAGLLAGAACAGGSPSAAERNTSDMATPSASGVADAPPMPSGDAHQCSADHNCNGKMKLDGVAQPSASAASPAQKP